MRQESSGSVKRSLAVIIRTTRDNLKYKGQSGLMPVLLSRRHRIQYNSIVRENSRTSLIAISRQVLGSYCFEDRGAMRAAYFLMALGINGCLSHRRLEV